MSKHLAGDKYASSHSTIIELAYELLPFLERRATVKKIILGVIESGIGHSGGTRLVKITMEKGQLDLIIRQSRSHQRIRVLTEDPQNDCVAFARHVRNKKIDLRFGKHWKTP